jgi:HSP20 family molecular chaperone IbpA
LTKQLPVISFCFYGYAFKKKGDRLNQMASGDWDIIVWQRARNLLQQAERIQANFLKIAVGTQYRAALHGRSWAPPVNVVETDDSFWVICAIPGVVVKDVDVRLDGPELIIAGQRPLPSCCHDGDLKLWEIPLGRFERRISVRDARGSLSIGKVTLQDGLLIIELKKNS